MRIYLCLIMALCVFRYGFRSDFVVPTLSVFVEILEQNRWGLLHAFDLETSGWIS